MPYELDDVMHQVLVVVQEMQLPCDDADVAEVVQDIEPADIRRALRDLGEEYLEIRRQQQDGILSRVEVLRLKKRVD